MSRQQEDHREAEEDYREAEEMKPDPSTHKRSVVKAVSWETFSNLVCGWLAYKWFGNFTSCVLFTTICFIVKLILFYYHERIWHQIPYGKIYPPDTR